MPKSDLIIGKIWSVNAVLQTGTSRMLLSGFEPIPAGRSKGSLSNYIADTARCNAKHTRFIVYGWLPDFT